MIVSIPSPPLLLPGVTGRPVAEVEELRAACLAALGQLRDEAPSEVVVVGAAEPRWTADRPLAELVARTLLGQAGCEVPIRAVAIEPQLAPDACLALGRTLAGSHLLVVADGSARRGVKAPGYLDERAAPFDQRILDALRAGDPAGLAGLDARLAAELMVAGRAAWQVMAGAAEGGQWQSEMHYQGDPFGVFYPVAIWL